MAGEVGLSGEIRPVNRIEQRISEAEKLGFSRMLIPKQNMQGLDRKKIKIRLAPVRKVEEAFLADLAAIYRDKIGVNERSRTLTKNGKNIDLTQVEFQIMECFLKNPNVALERNTVLSKVWGENYFGDVKIVDVNIRRLRMKIEDEPSNPKYLTTVWGYGYKWSVSE